MLAGKYREFYKRVSSFVADERIYTDELRRLALGTDASFYRLVPEIIVKVETEEEVINILKIASTLTIPVTFRAAGTSLSGQSISDSVLLVLGNGWRKYTISEDASTIRLQPAIIGSQANAYLARYGKKIGPDPASINAAMIGGIAANNASGMCCGTAQNSYRTLRSMRIVLCDGTVLDTSSETSKRQFLEAKKDFVERLSSLSRRIKENAPLSDRIRKKYKMKNTTGYSLNAFVDYDDPCGIIEHLMIGSEGTLGFISEITYDTVPEYKDKASSLMLLADIQNACRAVEVLNKCTVDAVELMDRASLRSVEDKPGVPEYLKGLPENTAALLVETRAENQELLNKHIAEIISAVRPFQMIFEARFTMVAREFEQLWNIRKGLFPSVGAMRQTGSTCIIEDVAFPVAQLANAVLDLQVLFKKYGYHQAIIFGHALDGNIHFVFNQDFNNPSEVERYRKFIDEVTGMVVRRYDGSLKAEHGTGRNMAPFVELEWGSEAYRLMEEIKDIFDPEYLLNPGVILNDDPRIHLKNLKPLPTSNPIIDKCIECGFCDVHCPSKDLTLTPRQRIVVYRELSKMREDQRSPELLRQFSKEFDYYGNQTCATDGLCALACPVGIDTGKLIKELRFTQNSRFANIVASLLSAHMGAVTAGLRIALNIVGFFHTLLGTRFMSAVSSFLRRAISDVIPLWNQFLPKGTTYRYTARPSGRDHTPTVVYFPSCINRSMGVSKDYEEDISLVQKTIDVLTKAGYTTIFPEHLNDLCCGMAFDSKGFRKQGYERAKELESALLKASKNGEYPIYVDMSPCLYRMKETLDKKLALYEPIEFILRFLTDKLVFHKLNETIVIHNTCSSTKMELNAKFKELAELCATNVVVPDDVECCGWAGDRGFTYPELNKSALMNLHQHIPDDCSHGYSTSRTCEIGLSLHSGISYKSIIYLVAKCTTAK